MVNELPELRLLFVLFMEEFETTVRGRSPQEEPTEPGCLGRGTPPPAPGYALKHMG